MKHTLLTAAFLGLTLASCGKKESELPAGTSDLLNTPQVQSTPTPAPSAPSTSATTSTGGEGLALIEGSDCLSCHKADAKLIGPSYKEIAAKYTEADTDMLADKIINGGKGNWGEVPMAPHPGISKEDAQKMVKYILTQK